MGTFHGITSLVLLALAMLVGLICVALNSPAAAVVYTLIVGGSFLVICAAYCTKCACRRNNCGHLLPGLVAQRLPARRQTPYNAADLILTGLAIAAMVFYPQPWLWHMPVLLGLFWLLAAVAAVEIVLKVCRHCRNTHCPLQRSRPAIRPWRADKHAD